jgi:hypothetical protein
MQSATRIEPAPAPGSSSRRSIPTYLVREVIDGIPFYYKGYRKVINKTKTLEDIMSDSGLQFFLKLYIYDLLKAHLNLKRYRVGAGELGFHPNFKNNMGLDVVVFEKTVLTPDKIGSKFVNVPPKMVVEVDVNVELPDRESDLFQEYVLRKIRRLFSTGVEKVIWVFTKSRNICVATPDGNLRFYGWDQTVELMDGASMNIAQHIEEEGFNLL